MSHPLVFMRFRPAWSYIDGIREFTNFFCQTTFDAPDVAERACVIIQETLENAVKYSTHDSNSELELVIESDGSRIEFSVLSTPDPAHLSSLKDELTDLHSLAPEQAYVAALERAAQQPGAAARLGLARVRFEGNAELVLKEEEGGRIRITAMGKL